MVDEDWADDAIPPVAWVRLIGVHRERARTWLAFGLLALLAAVTLAYPVCAAALAADRWERVEPVLSFSYTALVGLVGVVAGFYYAQGGGRR